MKKWEKAITTSNKIEVTHRADKGSQDSSHQEGGFWHQTAGRKAVSTIYWVYNLRQVHQVGTWGSPEKHNQQDVIERENEIYSKQLAYVIVEVW